MLLLYIFIGIFLSILIFTSKLVPTIAQIFRIYAWKKFARDNKMTFLNGTFFNSFGEPAPRIVGTYRQRSIIMSADTYGKFGFFDSFTQIIVPVKNRFSANFPKGGFFYSRRANLRDKFFMEYQKFFSESTPFSSYRIYSEPENLGNFINRHSSFQKLVLSKRFSGLVIKEQNLYFRRGNVDVKSEDIRILLDYLCDVAEAFDQYAFAWAK